MLVAGEPHIVGTAHDLGHGSSPAMRLERHPPRGAVQHLAMGLVEAVLGRRGANRRPGEAQQRDDRGRRAFSSSSGMSSSTGTGSPSPVHSQIRPQRLLHRIGADTQALPTMGESGPSVSAAVNSAGRRGRRSSRDRRSLSVPGNSLAALADKLDVSGAGSGRRAHRSRPAVADRARYRLPNRRHRSGTGEPSSRVEAITGYQYSARPVGGRLA